MTIHQNGLFVQPSQGRYYYFGQDFYTFKAIGEEIGEAYALCEVIVAPGGGTPPHWHSRENESFYVQDGEIEFQLDDRTFVATSGTFLHSPKGQITSTPPLSSEDLNKILTTAPKYGIEIVPPPSK